MVNIKNFIRFFHRVAKKNKTKIKARNFNRKELHQKEKINIFWTQNCKEFSLLSKNEAIKELNKLATRTFLEISEIERNLRFDDRYYDNPDEILNYELPRLHRTLNDIRDVLDGKEIWEQDIKKLFKKNPFKVEAYSETIEINNEIYFIVGG